MRFGVTYVALQQGRHPMNTRFQRLGVLAVAWLFSLAISVGPGLAAGDPDGTRGPQPDTSGNKKKKGDQGNYQENMHDAYLRARALIVDGQYEAGIAAMHALGHDDNVEVANYVGYASRKLGRYEDAKVWYERALASDPNHTRTWQYYGMWQLEQGNRLKAEDYLQKIGVICGNTDCGDYKALKDGIAGNIIY
jgi:tetratricopeptide (TPR) repeat protein